MYVDDAWVGLPNGTVVDTGKAIGTNAFGAIQPAINAATTGDEVDVAAGHYAGTLVVNKSLQLKGEGSDLVTIPRAPALRASARILIGSPMTTARCSP
jgi:pectin methylesterase-like acyl-CoA thioesterase